MEESELYKISVTRLLISFEIDSLFFVQITKGACSRGRTKGQYSERGHRKDQQFALKIPCNRQASVYGDEYIIGNKKMDIRH